MGSLAMWSAVAGAGKGWAELSQARMEDESYAKRAKIDEDREARLEKIRQSGRIEIQGMGDRSAMERQQQSDEAAMERLNRQGEQNVDIEERRHGYRMEEADLEAFNRENLQTIEQNWRSIENELDRLNNLSVADRRAGAGGSSDPLVKAYIDRYEKTQLTEQEMNQYGIAMSSRELPLTYDKMDGKFYAQEGDKLFLANAERPDLTKGWATPGDQHFNALAADPVRYEDTFLRSFGYLPGWFLAAKMQHGLHSLSRTGGTAESE